MPSREYVYGAIDTERNYQDTLNKNSLTVGEEILLAFRYIGVAVEEWTKDFKQPEQEALANLRKIAAICVRAMEHHGVTRNGKITVDTSDLP